jgi:hypothetical protein
MTVKKPAQRMLKNRKTGVVFPYNPDLARHPDMDDMQTVDEQFAEAKRTRKRKGPVRSRKKAAAKTEENTETPVDGEGTEAGAAAGEDESDDPLAGLTEQDLEGLEDV